MKPFRFFVWKHGCLKELRGQMLSSVTSSMRDFFIGTHTTLIYSSVWCVGKKQCSPTSCISSPPPTKNQLGTVPGSTLVPVFVFWATKFSFGFSYDHYWVRPQAQLWFLVLTGTRNPSASSLLGLDESWIGTIVSRESVFIKEHREQGTDLWMAALEHIYWYWPIMSFNSL